MKNKYAMNVKIQRWCMKRIVCDLDGTICEFNTVFTKLIIKETGKDLFPKGWEHDPTFPPCWDFPEHFGYTDFEIHKVWQAIKNDIHFWENLPALPGTSEAIRQLQILADSGHDIYFLTCRPGFMSKYQTEQWLIQHGMVCPTVIVVSSFERKKDIVKGLDANIFIDDHPWTAEDIAIKAENENWLVQGHVYLMAAPHNIRTPISFSRVTIVKSVMDMLESEELV
jgi:hypothetical protein